jgi:tetratricopeptide (TPR) repeat protein
VLSSNVKTTFKIACIAQALLAALLCFVPLFDVLSYEFSLAIGLLTTITSFSIGMSTAADTKHGPRRIALAIGYSYLQLVAPLILICLNALRVRNCDFQVGLIFFLILPVAAATLNALLGVLAQTLLKPCSWATRIGAYFIFLGIPLISIGWDFYSQPPISVFSHVWGYNPGTLYDEAIAPDQRLLAWRSFTMAIALSMAALLSLFDKLTIGRGLRILSTIVLALGLYSGDQVVGAEYLYRVDREVLDQRLPVIRSVPGLTIHMPPNVGAQRADEILADHQFHLDLLHRKLAMEQFPPIHSYVYTNATMKGSLLGGHNTMFAKPWLGEIHIHGLQVPHDVVAHELVHAVAAPLGTSFLQITTRSLIIPNMGLIEGFAEAFTTARGKLGLHEFARSMRDLKLTPKIQNLLSAEDFWRQSPARAYTVVGSFVRYLLEQYGAESVKKLYAHGDFSEVFNKDLAALVKEWNAFLDTVNVPDSGRRTARAAFHRPAIFKRQCAHVVADLKKELRQTSPEKALILHQKICDFEGQTPSARLALAFAFKRAGNIDEFLKLSGVLLEEQTLRPYQKNRLYEQLGNVYWNQGKTEEATKAFKTSFELGVDLKSQRAQWIKLDAMQRPLEQAQPLMRYLAGKMKQAEATTWLQEQTTLYPEDETLNYLYGRNLFNRQKFPEAIATLLKKSHPFKLIQAEIHRVSAAAAWHSKALEIAKIQYQNFQEIAPNSGEFERATEWLERIKWKQNRVLNND